MWSQVLPDVLMASATFKTPAAASPSSFKTPDAHERSRRLAENAASERSRRDLEQNAQETAQSAKAGRKLAEMLASAEEERKNQRGGKPWYVLDPESTVVKFRDMASFLALVHKALEVATHQGVFQWRDERERERERESVF